MSKKRKFETALEAAHREMSNFKYKDLKRGVVVRGMDFQEVVNGDYHSLTKWFVENYERTQNTNLLDQYDDWVESTIRDKSLIHPSLRLGYIGERDEETGEVTKTKRPKGIKKKRSKKERDTRFNIFKGTAKSFTYECQSNGLTLQKTLEKVFEQYPNGCSDKSVRIWFKRAEKLKKSKPSK